MKFRNIFIVLFILFILSFRPVGAASLSVRLEEPKTPSNDNKLHLNFVALDIENRLISAQCFQKHPEEANFSQFDQALDLEVGGDSANCLVDEKVFTKNGVYQFFVRVSAGEEIAESEIVDFDFSRGQPGKPLDYQKSKIGECEYKIEFKTADDDRTSKVVFYRSLETEFRLDESTEIGEQDIGPNEKGEFNNFVDQCNQDYFFVLRSFDKFGNASDPVGDEIIQTVEVTKTIIEEDGQTGQQTEAIAVDSDAITQTIDDLPGEKIEQEREQQKAVLAAKHQSAELVRKPVLGFIILLFILVLASLLLTKKYGQKKLKAHKFKLAKIFLRLGFIFTSLGLVIFLWVFFPIFSQEISYRKNKNMVEAREIVPVNTDFGLVIAKINANSSIIASVDPQNSQEYQQALTGGVAHAKNTALPGEKGNVFLFSHSSQSFYQAKQFNSVFYLLDKLELNDQIKVFYQGKEYIYLVKEMKIVNSDEVDYLTKETEAKKQLTLMTCTPPGTTLKRLLVIAELAED